MLPISVCLCRQVSCWPQCCGGAINFCSSYFHTKVASSLVRLITLSAIVAFPLLISRAREARRQDKRSAVSSVGTERASSCWERETSAFLGCAAPLARNAQSAFACPTRTAARLLGRRNCCADTVLSSERERVELREGATIILLLFSLLSLHKRRSFRRHSKAKKSCRTVCFSSSASFVSYSSAGEKQLPKRHQDSSKSSSTLVL